MMGAMGGGVIGQQMVAMHPPVITYPLPVSPPKVQAPSRPVYRHTARSTAKVQSRRWARTDETPRNDNAASNTGSSIGSVIPMQSIKDPNLMASARSADADELQQYNSMPKDRLVPIESPATPQPPTPFEQEAPHSSPQAGGLYGAANLEASAFGGAQQAQVLRPSPQALPVTPCEATPVKRPYVDLDIRGAKERNGSLDKIDVTQQLPNQKQEFWDLEVSNPFGSIQFDGVTDISKIDFEKDLVLKHCTLNLYPDGQPPRVGEGLNKPATVKLYNVKPERGGKQIDPKKYENALRKSLSGGPSEHLRYEEHDAVQGWVWTFKMACC